MGEEGHPDIGLVK